MNLTSDIIITWHNNINMSVTVAGQRFTVMVLQLVDEETHYRSHLYLTRQPSEDLTFCMKPGLPCIEQYINAKRNGAESKRREFLRQETSYNRIDYLRNH